MNDNNWNLELDGGALRLYPDTQDCTSIKEVVSSNPFVDIAPINGRLLVFDSRLIHAVQPVTSTTKCRRAMTLWIQRPNNSGAGGDGTFGG